MAALKQGTADLHEAVERHMDLGRMTGSPAGYLRTLRAFYGFYEPIESRLAAAPADGFDFAPESKTPRLAADLRALGERDLDRLPRCAALPQIDSTPRLVGALYVLEGASLGGRIISRLLRERLGVTPDTGGRFFYGSGEQTGPRWRAFGQAAEAAMATEHDVEEAVAAAQETFAALDRWLADHDSSGSEEVE